MIKRRLISTFIFMSLVLSSFVLANEADFTVSTSSETEKQDRLVDQAAISAQVSAEKKILELLKKYRGTERESHLLGRLAEAYQNEGALRFRVIYGSNKNLNTSKNETEYKTAMSKSIKVLTDRLLRFKNHDQEDLSYFMRAKAYHEINEKNKAKVDYLFLVNHYPHSEARVMAYMTLAEYEIDANNHEKSIVYLKEVEKEKNSLQYPFALYKEAWSYYNLKNYSQALSYLDKHIQFYFNQAKKESSDELLIENSSLDYATFYHEAMDKDGERFKFSSAYDDFKDKIPSYVLGKTILRFAKHLRSTRKEKELAAWFDLLSDKESTREETLGVANLLFEDRFNKRNFKGLGKTLKSITRFLSEKTSLKETESFKNTQKILLGQADKLQEWIKKNKASTEVHELASALSFVYEAFISLLKENDPQIAIVHYNLAETYFIIQDYKQATKHYLWITQKEKNQKKEFLNTVWLKQISSRYEELLKQEILGKKLKAVAMSNDTSSDLNSDLSEWLLWIDKEEKNLIKADLENYLNFKFEAARGLYGQKHISDSLVRFWDILSFGSKTKFFEASSSLILDTYIETQDWKVAYDSAKKISNMIKDSNSKYKSKITETAVTSYSKLLEKAYKEERLDDALELALNCTSDSILSVKKSECHFKAGQSYFLTKKYEKSIYHFSQVMAYTSPSKSLYADAIIGRAKVYEEQSNYKKSAQDYYGYMQTSLFEKLSLDAKKAILLKAINFFEFEGDAVFLKILLADKKWCSISELTSICQRHLGLYALEHNDASLFTTHVSNVQKVIHAQKSEKALWATIGLRSSKSIPFKDRNLYLKVIAQNLDDLDKDIQLRALPEVFESLTIGFDGARKDIEKFHNLKTGNLSTFTPRLQLIKEMEEISASLLKQPWAQLKVIVLSQNAKMYNDLTESMRLNPGAWGDNVFKLEEKTNLILKRAFEVAGHFGVERESFKWIADTYLSLNQSTKKEIEVHSPFNQEVEWDSDLLDRLDTAFKWQQLKSRVRHTEEEMLLSNWIKAFENKKRTQLLYAYQEVFEHKNKIDPLRFELVKAFTLSQLGAQSEALEMIYDQKDKLLNFEKGALLSLIIQTKMNRLAQVSVKKIIEDSFSDLRSGSSSVLGTDTDLYIYAYAMEWSKAETDFNFRSELFKKVTQVRNLTASAWAKLKLQQLKLSQNTPKGGV